MEKWMKRAMLGLMIISLCQIAYFLKAFNNGDFDNKPLISYTLIKLC